MANETPSRPPPPFMANAILNFHFDFLHPSLRDPWWTVQRLVTNSGTPLKDKTANLNAEKGTVARTTKDL